MRMAGPATAHLAVDEGLVETAKLTATALKRAGVPFALAGSWAFFARGGPGSAHDVDVLLKEDDAERAVDVLVAAGFTACPSTEDWLVKVLHGDNLVDLIHHLNGGPVDDDLLDRADPIEVASVVMPVADATDLVASRLLALNAHACDLAPVIAGVRALREQVDWDAVTERAAASPYARATLQLLRDLDIVGSPPGGGAAAGLTGPICRTLTR